ncbi:hypothetical protein Bbelb_257970 [Branchiostoma belcheri]|nr:hypothetical protein Bbelb_257970 [Branchiostoma belcheri]
MIPFMFNRRVKLLRSAPPDLLMLLNHPLTKGQENYTPRGTGRGWYGGRSCTLAVIAVVLPRGFLGRTYGAFAGCSRPTFPDTWVYKTPPSSMPLALSRPPTDSSLSLPPRPTSSSKKRFPYVLTRHSIAAFHPTQVYHPRASCDK